jgi:hypothetical protein
MKRCAICVSCVLALAGCGSSAHAPTRAARKAAETWELALTLQKADRLALETTEGRDAVEMVPKSKMEAQLRRYQTLQESLRRAFKDGDVVALTGSHRRQR